LDQNVSIGGETAIRSLPIYEQGNFQWQVAKNLDPLYKHEALYEYQNIFLEKE
jgi:hypothetical protein